MLSAEAIFRPPPTLRPEQGQSFAMQVEVDQSEADAQPVMVLVDSPISDLVETEDVLQYSEGMFNFGPDARLGRVLTSGFFIHVVPEPGPAAGHILGVGRGLADHFCLPLIAAVAPYLALFSVQ